MSWILALLLLIVPLLEVWLWMQVPWPLWLVLLECAATAGVGWYFARGEDWTLWTELESGVQNGRVPTLEGVDALLLLIGAWGLIVPGLLTDLAGALLLAPPLRRVVGVAVRESLRARIG
jgi:UPF0716 protein FxsA